MAKTAEQKNANFQFNSGVVRGYAMALEFLLQQPKIERAAVEELLKNHLFKMMGAQSVIQKYATELHWKFEKELAPGALSRRKAFAEKN